MGGLVIKKAHILASQCADYKDFAARFHSIYFLATPHRGSDSASTLSSLLQAANSPRGYVIDLERCSGAIQSINDEFRNCCASISIWSFYETQKLRTGMTSSLIVDTESAILGYPGETQIPTNADHRSICKFETPTDPTYISLRNAFATTVEDILRQGKEQPLRLLSSATISIITYNSVESVQPEQSPTDPLSQLRDYLNVSTTYQDDLASVKDARIQGTCEWFLTKEQYQSWSHYSPEAPRLLWVSGRPAAGKSVLTGYLIEQLLGQGAYCSYFFFKHGDISKSYLGTCLRSLVFQMASQDIQTREKLLVAQQIDRITNNDSERTVWRKLSQAGILHSDLPVHYWIIDALDECADIAPLFESLLANLDVAVDLRVLVTSRDSPELAKQIFVLGTHRVRHERITPSDTHVDIKSVVAAKTQLISLESEQDRVSLRDQILERAEGSFLWTILVLVALARSYSDKDIYQALNGIPRDLGALYHRTVTAMSTSAKSDLAKAILVWTTCATRPLTLHELGDALRVDINDTFARLEETIMAVCGHLVIVDKFGKVQMVHGTAREFLLDDNLESEFAIKKMDAHTRMVRVCLKYLTGEDMKPPRNARRGAAMAKARQRSEFLSYASNSFSYHLARCNSLADDVLLLLDTFLKSSVLTWIEIIALTRNLMPLIHTAKNVRIYYNSRSVRKSPLGLPMQTIKDWTSDLIRLVAKFSDALITYPFAIYTLIPPFCPSNSAIYGLPTLGRQLIVRGLTSTEWDDRLSCIDYRGPQASSVSYGDELFAVGLVSGKIYLYYSNSCQEYMVLMHSEAVKLLVFKTSSSLMVSCGIKSLRVWDTVSGDVLHQITLPQRVLNLAFDKNSLLAATSKEHLISWDLDLDEPPLVTRQWTTSGNDEDFFSHASAPCSVSISISHQMLAVGYSGRPIVLWDIAEGAYYGQCGKKWPNGEKSTMMVTALAFNPNPNLDLLAASYLDGELVLLDPFNDLEVTSFRAHIVTLASSVDGRLLAGGSGGGTIEVYDFETLTLLYRVKSTNFLVKQLSFSKDGLRFADIRGSQCNVWEPAVLLGNATFDDASHVSSPSTIEVETSDRKVMISAVSLYPDRDSAFCGKDDGSVSWYDLKTGEEGDTLYKHKSLVRLIAWMSQNQFLMSIDVSNVITAWRLRLSLPQGWAAQEELFCVRLDSAHSITQLLSSEPADKFLLSTRQSDHLWKFSGHQEDVKEWSCSKAKRTWMQHPESTQYLLCFESNKVRIHNWEDWSEIFSFATGANIEAMEVKSVALVNLGTQKQILLQLSETNGSPITKGLHLIEASRLAIAEPKAGLDSSSYVGNSLTLIEATGEPHTAGAFVSSQGPHLSRLAPFIVHILGIRNAKDLVFLDYLSWVCSVDIAAFSKGKLTYSRHFFVPCDWFAGTRTLLCGVTNRDAILAHHNDITIIRGFEHIEPVNI